MNPKAPLDMKNITPEELETLRERESDLRILDVRLADDFEAAHLPGALNNAVFEVAFTERLDETLPAKDQPVVLYGASRDSLEAPMAAEKLERAGYRDVAVLDGGIAAWEKTGRPTERGEPLPEPPPRPEGRRELDFDECRVRWTGRNLLTAHHGTIKITSGHLDFDQGRLAGGEVVFNLRSLKCTDLEGDETCDILIDHLLSHDFLDAGQHPDCRLVITEAHEIDQATPGAPNLDLAGELTLRGVTCPLRISAAAGMTPEGKAAAQAAFSIDRTNWGIIYGSGRFFDRLAGHLVNDLIDFDVRIITR